MYGVFAWIGVLWFGIVGGAGCERFRRYLGRIWEDWRGGNEARGEEVGLRQAASSREHEDTRVVNEESEPHGIPDRARTLN